MARNPPARGDLRVDLELETSVDGIAQPKPEFDIGWLNPSLGLDNRDIALAPA